MAVSKIAVMALVGILAVPILLGYALNLSEVTETDYKPDGETLKVTPLLNNGQDYTYAHADPYTINSHFSRISDLYPTLPVYSTTSARTNLPGQTSIRESYTTLSGDVVFSLFDSLYIQFDYDWTGGNYYGANITYNNGYSTYNLPYIHSFYMDYETNELYCTYYSGPYPSLGSRSFSNATQMTYYTVGSPTSTVIDMPHFKDSTASYYDISKGYYFRGMPGTERWYINMPTNTDQVTITVNLDSITDSSYHTYWQILGSYLHLDKDTIDGNVVWKADNNTLYYDPSRNDNTYQITVSYKYDGPYITPGDYKYSSTTRFDYVGGWPSIIGKSNSYWNVEINNFLVTNNPHPTFDIITILNDNVNPITKTPIIRVDDALFRAFEYTTIKDNTYDPASLKNNPATTIKDITVYGSSLSFGGNTYNVDTDGNITMGIHKIPVSGMVLDSVPVAVGYENRINGTVVSVTASPSVITFNGSWSANVETTAQVATTYTKTEWTAGQFAWDGMDTNFLIVGLITCLGVFVALGIYVRKSGKGMIPLLIVCGCCAGLFFCMI